MRQLLEDDQYCFVCGEKNPAGLHLGFVFHAGMVSAEFTLPKIYQGYKDIVHGGLISTILDETMIKAALMQGMTAITAEMTVRFRAPLLAGERAVCEASIVKSNRKIIEAVAVIKRTDEAVIAEGSGKLIRRD